MERQQKAYKGVIDYFKKKILDGELRPGEKLPPERDIAERLNVSRNSVREAIRIMEELPYENEFLHELILHLIHREIILPANSRKVLRRR